MGNTVFIENSVCDFYHQKVLQSMQKMNDIRRQLEYGDQKLIAEATGASVESVKKVLRGERGHKQGKGKKIAKMAMAIVTYRKVLSEGIKNPIIDRNLKKDKENLDE